MQVFKRFLHVKLFMSIFAEKHYLLKRLMYHTQEKRRKRISRPILCTADNAWLGDAYYFWGEEVDAIHWGNSSKKMTGQFDIYTAQIECENILNTVFNEEHYMFWLKQIEKAAAYISKKTGHKATLREINQYFKERANWNEVADGIMFQDLPFCDDLLVKNFNYRKRVQLAAYNLKIICNFAHHLEMDCM